MPHIARRLRVPAWSVTGPIVLYAILVLAGVTQSSIGISGLREDPAHPSGHMIGRAVRIRSDEYLTSTPLSIGVTATGSTADLNPLTAPEGFFTMLPSGPVSSVVLFDGTILRLGTFVPDQMLIAARWWFPFLLLALGAPAFFKTLTGSRNVGFFAAALIIFSPASAWWSFSLVGMLGFTIAGAAAIIGARPTQQFPWCPSVRHRERAAHAKGPGPGRSRPTLMIVRPRPINMTGTIGANHAVQVRLGHRPGTTTPSDMRLTTGPAESARTPRGRRGLPCRRRCPRSRLFRRTSVA